MAREIEGELVQRGISEIDRHELRRLAYETLYRRAGEQVAERYLRIIGDLLQKTAASASSESKSDSNPATEKGVQR